MYVIEQTLIPVAREGAGGAEAFCDRLNQLEAFHRRLIQTVEVSDRFVVQEVERILAIESRKARQSGGRFNLDGAIATIDRLMELYQPGSRNESLTVLLDNYSVLADELHTVEGLNAAVAIAQAGWMPAPLLILQPP